MEDDYSFQNNLEMGFIVKYDLLHTGQEKFSDDSQFLYCQDEREMFWVLGYLRKILNPPSFRSIMFRPVPGEFEPLTLPSVAFYRTNPENEMAKLKFRYEKITYSKEGEETGSTEKVVVCENNFEAVGLVKKLQQELDSVEYPRLLGVIDFSF